jgi:hypothetical protein
MEENGCIALLEHLIGQDAVEIERYDNGDGLSENLVRLGSIFGFFQRMRVLRQNS